MNTPLRHQCRNPKCRTKLKAPVGNEHKAFCCRGCFESFYRTKCIVCERDISTDPVTGAQRKRVGQRKFCRRKCKAEAGPIPPRLCLGARGRGGRFHSCRRGARHG
jgi:hypothetical protein